MLRPRLIPVILLKGDVVVQSFGFNRYLPIGNVKTAIEFFVNWDVDEIVILDISATHESRGPRVDIIERAAEKCFVPLTVGGGIRELSTIESCLSVGADKVSLNSFAFEQPTFVARAADRFGSQCITVSMDCKKIPSGGYEVFSRGGKRATGKDPIHWATELAKQGAGEIFLNSIDRDGSRQGYDIELLRSVTSVVNIPVISCGGVGKFGDLAAGITQGKCQAVAAANIFQHTELSTVAAKASLRRAGIPVRLSSAVKYENFDFDHLGRPL